MNKVYIILSIALILAVIICFITILLMRKKNNKKMLEGVNNLSIRKNNLDSLPVSVELNKIEDIAKSEQLEEKINDFKIRYQEIKETRITRINDLLFEMDNIIETRNIKEYQEKYTETEIEIYETEYSANKILEEINEIASYEEKYRGIVTKLKGKFRYLQKTYRDKETLFGDISNVIEMQLENIEKRFNDFDTVMEEKLYNEVVLVVKSLDTMIDHMDIILKEMPDILLLLNDLIPGRIEALNEEYQKMIEEEYPLGYLNFEENMASIDKKKNDIYDRAKVLNINDSLFDLRVILEYLDDLFKDLEKEKAARSEFESNNEAFANKISKKEKLIEDIYAQMDDIKAMYDLSENDLEIIDKVNLKLSSVIKEQKALVRNVKKHEESYQKHNVTMDELTIKLNNVSNELDNAIKSLGHMYDDEERAREQLKDMNDIIADCKKKIRLYHLPLIHDNYFVIMDEAVEAIGEVTKELENKPIVIKTLNIRVDTARDLVFKLNETTNNMIKYAYFTEVLVTYANRFRDEDKIDNELTKAEMLYYRGEYQDSYKEVLKVINSLDSELSKKILNLCK